jgi:phage gp45-like
MIGIEAIQKVTLESVDDSGPVQTCKLEGEDSEDPLEVESFLPYGFSSRAPAGSEGIAVGIGGDTTQATVIAAQKKSNRPTGLEEGEVTLDFLGTVKLYLGSDGKLYVGAKDADEPALKGTTTKQHIDTHVHPTAFGLSGAPTVELPTAALSSLVMVK